jgi:copper(I)-binding protein
MRWDATRRMPPDRVAGLRPARAALPAVARMLALAALLALAGCSHPHRIRAGDLTIEPAYANVAPTGDGGTAYFVVRNTGSLPDTVRSVAVVGATSAHLHTTTRSGGMERMTPLAPAVVPARGALVLEPGRVHLMFGGLTRPLRSGDTVAVRLEFARSGEVTVPLVVQPYGGA